MGLFDLFRFGRVAVATAQAVRRQRRNARELMALPMPALVAECVASLNTPHAPWKVAARPPHAQAGALCQRLALPDDLREFYMHCDGLAGDPADAPGAVVAVGSLAPGARFTPSVAQQLRDWWGQYENDSPQLGKLAVIPPDDLVALATNDAEEFVDPAALDSMLALLPPRPNQCTLLVTSALGPTLPAGAVLDVENGGATRYDSFRHWLAAQASLFGSMS